MVVMHISVPSDDWPHLHAGLKQTVPFEQVTTHFTRDFSLANLLFEDLQQVCQGPPAGEVPVSVH
jgi:hypothetical protein